MSGAVMQYPETFFDMEDLIVEEQVLENALVFAHPFGRKEQLSRTGLFEYVGTLAWFDGPCCWLATGAEHAVAELVTVSAFFSSLFLLSLDLVGLASCSPIHGPPRNDRVHSPTKTPEGSRRRFLGVAGSVMVDPWDSCDPWDS